MPKPDNIPGAPRPATTAQINYLDILFNDCGFNRKQRNGFITRELSREVNYLDELSTTEASRFIMALKERKEDRSPQQEEERD